MKSVKNRSLHLKLKDIKILNRSGEANSSFLFCWKLCINLLFVFITANSLYAQQKQLEGLGRGVVAVRTSSNQVFVSWRLLNNEPSNVGFNLYRGSTRLNNNPIITATNYVDNTSSDELYRVRPVIDGVEQEASAPAAVWAQQHLSIPLRRPEGGTTPAGENYSYSPNDASVGDLDGDGEYEIIVKWDPSNAKDNSHTGYTGSVYLDAYKLDGTHLWRISLGRNIRAGAHYTQFIVYDLDSDGIAEIACKTAPNTKDGTDNFLSMGPAANDDDEADYRTTTGDRIGYVLSGPEYLTIFNGQTGAEMATTLYIPDRYPTNGWGSNREHHNRVDRFLAGVGYFDGERPSLLMCRGYYGRSVLVAWDWRNGELTQRWKFDSNDPGNGGYAGQGNHSLSINDVDGDGKDEVIYGSMAVDHDGTGLYTTRLGHGDAQHVGDLLPGRPGLESWSAHECVSCYDGNGLWLRDAGTGEKLWGVPANNDVGRGLSADIDSRYPGNEMWGSAGGGVFSSTGQQISTAKPSINFATWWDGDLLREILDGDKLDKWNENTNSAQRILTLYNFGAEKINGTKSNPNLSADILGDWREEIIIRHHNNTELLVFTTTAPTIYKIPTLMHDSQYRVAIAWQNVAYNQPPHTSFFLGANMNAKLTTADNPEDFLLGDATEGIEFNESIFTLTDAFGTTPDAGLTFSKGIGPDWLEVAADGTLSGTPADEDTGENTFTIRVSNQDGDVDLLILKFDVVDVNNPPVWNEEIITKTVAVVGYEYQGNLSADVSDADSESALQFTKVSGPDWLQIAADGSLSGTPGEADLGENTFVVSTTDDHDASAEGTIKISVVASSLTHHYQFNGNTNDSEGGQHGIAVGAPLYQEGALENAIKFDGSNDYVSLPAGIVNYHQITISAWVNWNGGGNWQRIFDFGDNNTSYMFLTPGNGSEARFAIRTPEVPEQIISTSTLPVGVWKHVAVTIRGSTAKLYIDGVEVGENNGMTLLPSSLGITQQNFIGNSQWPDPLLNGQIDDFRIYNYPLSAGEIGELFSSVTFKDSQTITFGPLEPKKARDTAFDPAATASSGLVVAYTSSNTEVATVVDGMIHIVGPGTTTITATQEGNEEYEAAEPVSQELVVEEITSIPGSSVSGAQVLVYPNPSSGSYTLELKDFKPGKVTITVVDGNGKQVLENTLEVISKKQIVSFKLDSYSPGLFFLQLRSSDSTKSLKISLQR